MNRSEGKNCFPRVSGKINLSASISIVKIFECVYKYSFDINNIFFNIYSEFNPLGPFL